MYCLTDFAESGAGADCCIGEVARGCPGLLDLSCMTVTGKTLGENINEYDIRRKTATAAARLLADVRARAASEPARPGRSPASPPEPDRRPPVWPCWKPKAKTDETTLSAGQRQWRRLKRP